MHKLQKVLADKGIASRRTIETWITKGRIKVNKQPATIGMRVDNRDRIEIDGKRVRKKSPTELIEWLIYHKPEGEITSRLDPDKRPCVFHKLPRPKNGRWISVGRLDINSSGLLVFTTSGVCANYLMHPSNQIDRVYMARVRGMLSQSELRQLREGVNLDGQLTRFKHIEFAGGESKNFWYRVSLSEGQYREVRRLFSLLEHEVGRLMRIEYGGIHLPPSLKRGQYRFVTKQDFKFLANVENACK